MERSPSWEVASRSATQEFNNIYGTWSFITVFTRALYWSPAWATSIQCIPPNPIFLGSIVILSSHLRLGLTSGLVHSGFPTKILHASPMRASCLPTSSSLTWSFWLQLTKSVCYDAPHSTADYTKIMYEVSKVGSVPVNSHYSLSY
jgi:hypothetical protein